MAKMACKKKRKKKIDSICRSRNLISQKVNIRIFQKHEFKFKEKKKKAVITPA